MLVMRTVEDPTDPFGKLVSTEHSIRLNHLVLNRFKVHLGPFLSRSTHTRIYVPALDACKRQPFSCRGAVKAVFKAFQVAGALLVGEKVFCKPYKPIKRFPCSPADP
jgi:hypothetical protein